MTGSSPPSGVADLAPAWLDQAAPQARMVVPLDVRGNQLSVAFERRGPAGALGQPGGSRRAASCGCAARWPAPNAS